MTRTNFRRLMLVTYSSPSVWLLALSFDASSHYQLRVNSAQHKFLHLLIKPLPSPHLPSPSFSPPHVPPKLPKSIMWPLTIKNPHLLSLPPRKPLQNPLWLSPSLACFPFPKSRPTSRPLHQLRRDQRRDVGEAGEQLTREGEIGFLREGRGLQVVGAREGV